MDPFMQERVFLEIDSLNSKHLNLVKAVTKLTTIVGIQSKLFLVVLSFLLLWGVKSFIADDVKSFIQNDKTKHHIIQQQKK